MKFALHTPASRPVIHQTLAQGGTSMSAAVTIVPGLTPGAEEDCFYGWGERHRGAECKPHNLVQSSDLEGITLLARRLMEAGNEVVITENRDWSLIVPNAPIFYLATHTH